MSARAAAMPFAGGFRVVSPYGLRTDPITGRENCMHGGVDLVGEDTLVRAAAGGTVLRSRMVTDPADRTSEWGNYVSVFADDGTVAYYCHLEKRLAEAGERVEAGQAIGVEGSTGRSTGVHLHFETRDAGGVTFDPCAYLGIENRAGFVWHAEDGKKEPAWKTEASPWAVEAVGWAVERGILRGRGGGEYALKDPLTREEMCVMLQRAFGEEKTAEKE